MNVLILTPDAVGSTLLQRLITIYMQFHHYDRPVINLHELTNGLVKYHNEYFEQEILGKKVEGWGYHQSLEQIVQLLSSVDHYKTSRLAHYHIRNRQDPIADQISFYQYLNDNFYIISCRRHNLFEHALSWCISKVTKKLNVYSSDEKIDSFFECYKDGIDLDPNSLIQTLNAYKEYIIWTNNHFNVANYFYYEEHLPQIEKYILNLPIFAQQAKKLTWLDNFNMNFDQWNLCRYLGSDLGTLALDQPEKFKLLADDATSTKISHSEIEFVKAYHQVSDPSWPKISTIKEYKNLPAVVRDEVENTHKVSLANTDKFSVKIQLSQPMVEWLPESHQKFLNHHKKTYDQSMESIYQMVTKGILVSNPPIKKQTLAEKKHMIKNYQHLLTVYNRWIEQNPDLGRPLDNDTLDQFADMERFRWSPASTAIAISD